MREEDIHIFLRLIKKSVKKWSLPFVERLAAQGSDPFIILVSCILSLRTRDQTTVGASERLFAIACDPCAMAQLNLKTIEKAIFPVGFFRTKAKQIKAISEKLCQGGDGTVPRTLEDLLCLPGVGRKTANLVLTMGYKKLGICVDTHVHRICNRWGYVATRDAEVTEQVLRKTLPRRYWKGFNGLLVPFGQNQCTPISPRCSSCPLDWSCEKVGVTGSR